MMDMKQFVKILVIGLVAVVLAAGIVAGWLLFPRAPMPMDELVPPDADFEPAQYETSMAPDAGHPDILILGTTHLTQRDELFPADALEQVAEAMTEYRPDLVAVEYLGPDSGVYFSSRVWRACR